MIILDHSGWPGGVVGIVASRLVDRYHKPAILFTSSPGEPARGSARSIPGVDITAAIAAQADLLLNFGGHPMAAGLSLDSNNLPAFRRRMARAVESQLAGIELEDQLEIDGWQPLDACTLELAAVLECLAPYGPGNEKLTFATHGLNLGSAAALGRNQEHLKLSVVDESNCAQSIFWWNGAGETLPAGKFDLAYTLRAVDWRGERQVQLEFVDFRVLPEEVIEIATSKREIIDYRRASEPLRRLAEIRSLPSTLVWAEGAEKGEVKGVDRNGLGPAEALVIWTAPASITELRRALEKVNPRRIYLFATDDPVTYKEFLSRLAGLLKYVVQERDCRTSLDELAAACGQRPATIRLGLEWFAAAGHFEITTIKEGELEISPTRSTMDDGRAFDLRTQLQSLIDETEAYRAYFRSANKDDLGL